MLQQGSSKKKMVAIRKRSACRSCALWVAAVLVFLFTQSPVVAQELAVRFDTGGDDLRGGNDNVHLVLFLRTGALIRFENVNDRNRWPDNSSQPVSRPLPETFRPQDVIGIGLETTFGGGIGGDNWNLDRLQVTARLGDESCLLFDQRGTPLFRFTGEQRVRHFSVASDLDSDGLPECWESARRGLGLSPLKANLILVPVLEPGLTREEVQPTLNKVVDFFARMPNRNPDGSTGIGVVIQWGNSLPDLDGDLRVRGIPAALIGKGHGILIGAGTGGGGQTGRSDWSGASNNWQTIVHELGHQLGLGHEPRGTGIPSPLYTSIMNYDYNYQFNGNPDAVHFSSGRFSSVRLNERALNETLFFPRADLEFLTREPYRFGIQAAGPGSTNVDFNRNGISGESGVRADVNGGTAVTARDRTDFAETAGGFALATFGRQLVAVFPDLLRPIPWADYIETGLSVRNAGRLRYQIHTEGGLSSPREMVNTGVTGDPHAIEAFGYLLVTFPTAGGYSVRSYVAGPTAGSLQMVDFRNRAGEPSSHPILVRTSGDLYLFIWSGARNPVRYRKVMVSASGAISFGPLVDLNMNRGGSIRSNSPVGGTWNSRNPGIALVTTARTSRFQGRMKMVDLIQNSRGRWVGVAERWVMGASDAAATLARPTVLFDDRPSAGATGQYLIYSLWERSGPDATLTELIRLTPNSSPAGGTWTKQLMQNVWTSTRSAPAAALYGDDVAWGWRVNETFPVVPNILQVFLQASGITDFIGPADFNDVEWIAGRGLSESLRSVSISR